MTAPRSKRVTGGFTAGAPLDFSLTESVEVPEDMVDEGDALYRVVGRGLRTMNIRPNDVLVVQPRPNGDAATAELVLVENDGRAYVGRWWTKRGRRALVDERHATITEGPGMRVLGAITVIARFDTDQ